jgi:hypothetical protein
MNKVALTGCVPIRYFIICVTTLNAQFHFTGLIFRVIYACEATGPVFKESS